MTWVAPVSLDTFTLASGFRAAGGTCGLKASGREDLALVVADRPCAAAGVFTTNRVVAAPVLLDRELLAAHAHEVRGIVVNSGCANACTGARGMTDARRMGALAASAIDASPGQVLVLSTGVIGVPLDTDKIARGLPAVAGALGDGPEAVSGAVRAILTTDTVPKTAAVDLALGGGRVRIRGFAKGAGMIHPNMATMLGIVTTDAGVDPALLQELLRGMAARSFNRVSVDGDMSTNDTVLLLASGASGVKIAERERAAFAVGLEAVGVSLARQIARDGEGATRLVEIAVEGTASEREAHTVADAIARSPLVKTAVHGGDPNWGRVLAAAGSCGIEFDPARARLSFGPASDAVVVVEGGTRAAYDERAAAERLRRDPVEMRLELGQGSGSAIVWTCDFSAEYVSINAEYTT